MCFSASASALTSLGLAIIGLATLYRARLEGQTMLASVPLLFAVQQAAESVIWFNHLEPLSFIYKLGTYVFVLFVFIVWPIWIPLAVLHLERLAWRRTLLKGLLVMGLSYAAYFLITLLRYGAYARIVKGHIYYHVSLLTFLPFSSYAQDYGVLLYVLITIMPFFISSRTGMKLFGLLLLLSYVITYSYWPFFFVSVGCFFAALLSIALYMIIGRQNATRLVFQI